MRHKDDTQYKNVFDMYRTMVFWRINDTQIAMMQGRDGKIELANLLSLMYADIFAPIKETINTELTELDKDITEITEKHTTRISRTHHSYRHNANDLFAEINIRNQITNNKIINIIINRMNELKLLMPTEPERITSSVIR